MLTNKEKKILKKMANNLNATHQIGKEGLTDNLITDVRNYLIKNELIKISILQNCPMSKEEIAERFITCGFELVGVVGRTITLYMHTPKAKKPIVF